MDAFEVSERVRAIEEEKARAGRIDWYDRNAPVWWRSLKDMIVDPVWGESMDSYCEKWFGHSEAEMAEFLGLEKVPKELEPVRSEHTIAEQVMEKKRVKAKSDAERAKAYRERKKAEELPVFPKSKESVERAK